MATSLSKLGEFPLIERLTSPLPPLPKKNWPIGIGDDTSVKKISHSHYQLLTQDMLLEGVHFVVRTQKDFRDLGWKAIAVNLSDIAAMGGVPKGAVVALGIPSKATLTELDALYRGIKECSKKYDCPIVGGDTNRSKGGWVISVSIVGFSSTPPLLRRGAKVGDSLWVTGKLGGASLGWKATQKKKNVKSTASFRKRFLRPEPRLLWGEKLRKSGKVTSMIDISDGLAGDLVHLSESSGVGFQVEVEKIPRERDFANVCGSLKVSEKFPLLTGGEDYELLFTVRRGEEASFRRWLKKSKITASWIGEAAKGSKILFFEKNSLIKEKLTGFRHF